MHLAGYQPVEPNLTLPNRSLAKQRSEHQSNMADLRADLRIISLLRNKVAIKGHARLDIKDNLHWLDDSRQSSR